ncbi:MAG: hypothetical protein AcusKO_38630 [Acuticoccus sp.]
MRKLLAGIASALPLGTALAADLPPVPEPFDSVRVCDSYGHGYFVIPGTDACLRISGRVRTDYNAFFNDDRSFNFQPAQGRRVGENWHRTRVRAWLNHDVRKATQYGELRAYTELRFTLDYDGPTHPDLHQAFIELGGLRMGQSQSYYDFLGAQFTQTEFFDPQFSRDHPLPLIAYHAEFSRHFSAVVSVEDTTARRDGITSQNGQTAYGGAIVPDVIVRLQAGRPSDPAYVQLMAATHYVNAVTQGIGATSEQMGFAVGAGAATDVPIGDRTRIGITSTFARGALSFATTSASSPPGLAKDGVFDSATGTVNLTDYVTVAAGGRTYVAPTWEFAAQAGFLYSHTDPSNTDFNNDGAVDDLDFINVDAQAFLGWRPVSGLLMGVGAEYRFVEGNDFGQSSFLTTYFRAQRSF